MLSFNKNQWTDLHCKSNENISLHLFGNFKWNQLKIKVLMIASFQGTGRIGQNISIQLRSKTQNPKEQNYIN